MPSKTFNNLKPEKQQKIFQALLKEFSTFPLAKSQVARIIKSANIPRGSFYTYFSNLKDAYMYVLNIVLQDIHIDLNFQSFNNLDLIISKIENFIKKIQYQNYYQFIKLYFQYNESILPKYSVNKKTDTKTWMLSVLSHTTLKDIFLDINNQKFYLDRFKKAIIYFQR